MLQLTGRHQLAGGLSGVRPKLRIFYLKPMPENVEIKTEPLARFVTNLRILPFEEHFYILIESLGPATVYALTPAHLKRVYLLLSQALKEYENKHGNIETALPQPQQTQHPEMGFDTKKLTELSKK